MFGRLVRSLVGGDAAAPPVPRQSGEVRLDDILSIPNRPLRALFEQRYRDPAFRDGDKAEADAAHAAAFEGDALPVAIELLVRAPLTTMLRNQESSPSSHRLKNAIDDALERARQLCVDRDGMDLPIPDSRLPLMLGALGVLVAQGQNPLWGSGLWLEPVVCTAGKRSDPAVRRALIKMFDDFFAGAPGQHDQMIALAEKLLPISGLPRSAIPRLGQAADKHARLDAIRNRILTDAGEPLGAAIAASLDSGRIGFYALAETAKLPAFRTLCDLDPAGRGAVFAKALTIIGGLPAYGLEKWGELQRPGGKYPTHVQYERYLPGLTSILGVLAVRKMVLADPDPVMARFVAMLPEFYHLTHKSILKTIVEVARAHPGGKTIAALRGMVAEPNRHQSYSEWMTEIEDVLRDLPVVTAAPVPAASEPQPARATGFGRKGLSAAPISAAPSAPPLAGLAPIELPETALNDWSAPQVIGRHFDNLLDARLYDAPHRRYLERLAQLKDAIALLPGDDRRAQIAATIDLTKRAGFPLKPDSDGARAALVIGRTVDLGHDLDRRAQIFAPFVIAWPEQARSLGKLASTIASKSAPPAKWLADARAAVAPLDTEQRLAMLEAVITSPTPTWNSGISDIYLRTILYLSADLDPTVVGPRLADYALKKCYVTQKDVGIRAEKLGNACVWALAAMPGGAGIPYLARILARTKYPKIRVKIDARLNEAAAAAGVSRGALDELSVPTHDLDRDATLRTPIGGGEAVLRVNGARDVTIEWLSDSGKPLKSPSVAMKADKAALKAVRDTAKEVEADLGTLLVRLQRLYLDDRSWPAAEWQASYLDHPLVRPLARQLIWWVDGADGTTIAALADEAGEAMRDVAGKPVSLDGATIRLWHPIDAEVAEVEAWRDRLEAEQITQPFAQVWREVYALTDAERATGTYTNRWAAHILKQHQAMTLARLNSWRVTHRMWVDAPNDQPWHLAIPAHHLVVDYWVEGAGGDDPETSDSGAYAFVATDRVQFHSVEDGAADSAHGPVRGRAVPLTEIPPLVFSEVMRQADLFTAVASIAADPNWLDRGGDAAHPTQWGQQAAAYWSSTNTADLEESGKRRRAMLERIVPRLKIADKLSLDDRYLLVEGKRHNYRVHLGSGACFRGERHICIVPKSSDEKSRIWLPFEGDRTLSIIISKALLLAADDKITDPVILRQL